ncbi:tetratricopeptide repeat protein [Halomicronema sp. CCY15110]|uniref:tetratricopeptide repeat protein n=1 Tax=Halomicronema sp. CCY15110 TaxID=2767773 RepID=UPI001EF18864|nr:tetratricopeptide repeat protein [Halomicronema sp. CCY15110]
MAKGFGQPRSIPTRNATKFMHAFGTCYVEAKGDEKRLHQFLKANVKKLDEALLAALPVLPPKLLTDGKFGDKENIASLLGVFGSSLLNFPLGDRALNLELSIAAYQLALKVFTRKLSSQQWAAIQNNLGSAYSNRIRGDRADNLEQAIAAYELALQVRTRNALPEDWAATQNNLGSAYSDRIRGDRADNLEQAIAAYELALQIYTRNAFPENWAGTQNNLAGAYSDRIRGDRADNLEQAITACELALQVRTREAFPEQWADTQINLGAAYYYRIQGEKSENLELAIAAFKAALQVRTHEAFPNSWAATQNNLGNSFRDRIRGDEITNLAQAIQAYELANQVATCEALPEDWAMHRGNLAEALMKRAELTDNLTDLETAITLLQEAQEVAVPGSPDYIDSQYRLGNALHRRGERTKTADDLHKARQAYETALNSINLDHYDRAKIWQALPTTQLLLGSLLVKNGQWQEGLQLLLNSVRLLGDVNDHHYNRKAHADALYQTARAHEVMADLGNARLYYRDALRLYESLADTLGIGQSRYGLGSVLVSQGHFDKGMAELAQARDRYRELDHSDQADEIEGLYQIAQQAKQSLEEVTV